LTSVVAAVGPVRHVGGKLVPHLGAYHAAFLTATAVLFAGSVLALVTIRDVDAHPTMTRRQRPPTSH